MSEHKGLILGFPVAEEKASYRISFSLDPTFVRKQLIYWDQIEWPVFGPPFNVLEQAQEKAYVNTLIRKCNEQSARFALERIEALKSEDPEQYANMTVGDFADEMHAEIQEEVELVLAQRRSFLDEIKLLEEQGFVIRTPVDVPMSLKLEHLPEFYRRAQIGLLRSKNDAREETWSLAQHGERIDWGTEGVLETSFVEFELYRCLPVPANDVPLNEILEFKVRRAELLEGLRFALDSLYLSIHDSSELPRSTDNAVKKLHRTIVDVHRVLRETRIKTGLVTNAKTFLNTAAEIGVIGAGVASSSIAFGIPAEKAFGIAGATMALKFAVSTIRAPIAIPSDLKDFTYLYDVDNELVSNHPEETVFAMPSVNFAFNDDQSEPIVASGLEHTKTDEEFLVQPYRPTETD